MVTRQRQPVQDFFKFRVYPSGFCTLPRHPLVKRWLISDLSSFSPLSPVLLHTWAFLIARRDIFSWRGFISVKTFFLLSLENILSLNFYSPLFYLSPLLKRFRSLGTHSEKLILCPKGIQHLERGMRTKAMKTDTLVLLNTNRMYLRTIQTVKNKFWEGRHFPRNYRPYRECRLVAT